MQPIQEDYNCLTEIQFCNIGKETILINTQYPNEFTSVQPKITYNQVVSVGKDIFMIKINHNMLRINMEEQSCFEYQFTQNLIGQCRIYEQEKTFLIFGLEKDLILIDQFMNYFLIKLEEQIIDFEINGEYLYVQNNDLFEYDLGYYLRYDFDSQINIQNNVLKISQNLTQWSYSQIITKYLRWQQPVQTITYIKDGVFVQCYQNQLNIVKQNQQLFSLKKQFGFKFKHLLNQDNLILLIYNNSYLSYMILDQNYQLVQEQEIQLVAQIINDVYISNLGLFYVIQHKINGVQEIKQQSLGFMNQTVLVKSNDFQYDNKIISLSQNQDFIIVQRELQLGFLIQTEKFESLSLMMQNLDTVEGYFNNWQLLNNMKFQKPFNQQELQKLNQLIKDIQATNTYVAPNNQQIKLPSRLYVQLLSQIIKSQLFNLNYLVSKIQVESLFRNNIKALYLASQYQIHKNSAIYDFICQLKLIQHDNLQEEINLNIQLIYSQLFFSDQNFKFMEWLGKNGLKTLLKDLLNIYDQQGFIINYLKIFSVESFELQQVLDQTLQLLNDQWQSLVFGNDQNYQLYQDMDQEPKVTFVNHLINMFKNDHKMVIALCHYGLKFNNIKLQIQFAHNIIAYQKLNHQQHIDLKQIYQIINLIKTDNKQNYNLLISEFADLYLNHSQDIDFITNLYIKKHIINRLNFKSKQQIYDNQLQEKSYFKLAINYHLKQKNAQWFLNSCLYFLDSLYQQSYDQNIIKQAQFLILLAIKLQKNKQVFQQDKFKENFDIHKKVIQILQQIKDSIKKNKDITLKRCYKYKTLIDCLLMQNQLVQNIDQLIIQSQSLILALIFKQNCQKLLVYMCTQQNYGVKIQQQIIKFLQNIDNKEIQNYYQKTIFTCLNKQNDKLIQHLDINIQIDENLDTLLKFIKQGKYDQIQDETFQRVMNQKGQRAKDQILQLIQ